MTVVDISYLNLFLGLLLMLLPFYFLRKFKTGLLEAAIIGSIRMTIQLLLIGLYLRFLFKWDNYVINIAWTIIMAFIASYTAVSRTIVKHKILFMPVFIGLWITVMTISTYFMYIILRIDHIFTARYFIPVTGLLLGNMLTVGIMALNVFYGDLQKEQHLYYYLLGNGASRNEATAPFLKSAIIKSFSPCVANMAVLGLVSFPGTMIGQILGGSMPDVAIRYQLMISVITIVASMMSLIIIIKLSMRYTFDEFGRLKSIFKDSRLK